MRHGCALGLPVQATNSNWLAHSSANLSVVSEAVVAGSNVAVSRRLVWVSEAVVAGSNVAVSRRLVWVDVDRTALRE